MPARPAIAARCTIALVEPDSASSTRSAFSTLSLVTRSRGRMGSLAVASCTASAPDASAARIRSACTAGIAAVPGSRKPSVSARQAIVLAVPITPHDPAVVARLPSMRSICAASTSPARYFAQKRRQSVQAESRSPSKRVAIIGPPTTITAGTLALTAAISCAGTVLSQPPSRTTASSGWARTISSVSIAARLR